MYVLTIINPYTKVAQWQVELRTLQQIRDYLIATRIFEMRPFNLNVPCITMLNQIANNKYRHRATKLFNHTDIININPIKPITAPQSGQHSCATNLFINSFGCPIVQYQLVPTLKWPQVVWNGQSNYSY
jgi:hypothetical protein